MTPNVDDLVLSQLADGELPPDETSQSLLAVLSDDAARDRLKQHLQLRQLTAAWRTQQPSRNLQPASVAASPTPAPSLAESRQETARWHGSSVLVASLVGGFLVTLGFWCGKSSFVPPSSLPDSASARPSVVSPLQRQQISQVFAFYESVAGPLKCLASDDQAIEMAPADGETESARPLAIVLRLTSVESPSSPVHEFVIVCRQGVPVAIPLPHGDAKFPNGRLYLSPVFDHGEVGLSYSLAIEDAGGKSPTAVIAGRRQVGDDPRSLGELAMGDRLMRVEASAWPLDGIAIP
ncbi:MAG: hypothetical protein JSS02_04680 [Planctomycetes bacterium]|nr:hypothetical protein [Planctomycetota bacterium]